jgi:hypothetical protein
MYCSFLHINIFLPLAVGILYRTDVIEYSSCIDLYNGNVDKVDAFLSISAHQRQLYTKPMQAESVEV